MSRRRYRLAPDLGRAGHADDARRSRCSTAAWCRARTCSRRSCTASSRSASSRCSSRSIGYSLAFGTTLARRDRRLRLRRPRRASTRRPRTAPCRTLAFFAYQCMFAVITPALISGAFAERMKFSAYVAVHARLDDARLRSDRALVVGDRRLAREARRDRLRRRHRRAPVVGHLGARRRARARQAQRLSDACATRRTT